MPVLQYNFTNEFHSRKCLTQKTTEISWIPDIIANFYFFFFFTIRLEILWVVILKSTKTWCCVCLNTLFTTSSSNFTYYNCLNIIISFLINYVPQYCVLSSDVSIRTCNISTAIRCTMNLCTTNKLSCQRPKLGKPFSYFNEKFLYYKSYV